MRDRELIAADRVPTSGMFLHAKDEAMTTVKTEDARGGTVSRNHAVLKVLIVSLVLAVLVGLAITVYW